MNLVAETSALPTMPNDAADVPGQQPRATNLHRRRGLADLLPRAVSAAVLMVAALSSVWLGGGLFILIWFVAALAVALEWQNLIAAPLLRPRLGLVAVAFILAAIFIYRAEFAAACAILAVCGSLLAVAAGSGHRVWAFAGAVYGGAFLVSVNALHGSTDYGARSIIWLFATVWSTDVFAYFGGRLIGGPKLWPKISPSKTWSGTLTGILAGAVVGAAVAVYGPGDPWRAVPIFVLGLVTATVSQAGDLFESWVKRCFGAKDSSGLIPGHGGFMDRLDGFAAAAVFAALFGAARGLSSIAAGLFDWY